MERNRWETAIRCLEVALHPNTADGEVIAGVNGFRRTAGGTPLGAICRELAGADRSDGAAGDPAAATALDALGRENLALRRELDREREEQEAALQRLRDAELLARQLSAEIRAEQQSFAAFRAASAQIVDGLRDENFDLRGALDQARVEQARVEHAALAGRPPRALSPFRELLAATLERDGQPRAHRPAAAERPAPGHPWVA